MAKRKGISKKIRFEVFKRDDFTCQYCGRGAPQVVLNVDHITPVAKDGDNDILNLVTSCMECNSGKGARELSDDATIQQQRRQLEELNERREQLEMILQWREGLKSIADDEVQAVSDEWEKLTEDYYLNESGLKDAKKLIKKYSLLEVLEAIEIATERYLEEDVERTAGEARYTKRSIEESWNRVSGILRVKHSPASERDAYYIRGILRNRLSYINEWLALSLTKKALATGCPAEALKDLAKEITTWTAFREEVEAIIEHYSEGDE